MIKLIDILKGSNQLNENENVNNTFDRVAFYQQYYKNLSPSDFIVQTIGDTITIKINTNKQSN
jgi:hypothetical protein